jgi:phage major head subunit gpT-like protein
MAKTRSQSQIAFPRTIGSRIVDLPPLSIRAEVAPSTVNEDDRSVELVFSTGAAVERYDWATGTRYLETLSLDPEHVKLDRLNGGAPLLDSHSAWSVSDMLGAAVPGTASANKREGRVTVRFSKRDAVTPIWQDVRDGLIRSVSVGYRTYKYEETAPSKANALPVRLATSWEPFEVSMVSIPADAGAMARGAKPADTNQCQIVAAATRAAEKPPATPEREPKVMEDETRSEYIEEPTDDVPAPPPVVAPNERDAGVAAERKRCQGIDVACRAAHLPTAYKDKLIADGITLEAAQTRIFEELAKRDRDDAGPVNRPDTGAVVTGDDPLVHKRAGIEAAILHRVAPEFFKLTDEARPYRGMSLLDIGRVYLRARGIRTSQMSRSDLAEAMLQRAGMHSTSDFPSLLADVANKTLRAAYDAAPQTWRPLAKLTPLSDFKPSRMLQIGDAPALLEVLEHGEFTSGTIAEAKETVQLKTYGRIFAITRQALINDDTNAFSEVPAAFGRKAADLQADLAWAQITANPLMGDGVALFNAAHNNLSGTSDAISVASIGAGRASMRKQTGLDGVTLLNLSPKNLIVPAAKETIADQFVSTIVAAQSSNVNPFAGRLAVISEPRLDVNSGVSWYLATDVAQAPALYFITLDGQEGPDVRQMEGFDTDGLRYRCRLDVNFAPADFRALYKNPGA